MMVTFLLYNLLHDQYISGITRKVMPLLCPRQIRLKFGGTLFKRMALHGNQILISETLSASLQTVALTSENVSCIHVTFLSVLLNWCKLMESNHPSRKALDLQSSPLPLRYKLAWSPDSESN